MGVMGRMGKLRTDTTPIVRIEPVSSAVRQLLYYINLKELTESHCDYMPEK